MNLRILIAEDIELVAEAFEALLSTKPTFDVVGRVRTGADLLGAVRTYRPDVAVVDVEMPGMTGIEATAELRANGEDCKVLLLTALPGSGHLHSALAAGANGYLLKSTTGTRLIEAIETIHQGRTVIDPELAADALRAGPNPLTAREQDILRLVHAGHGTGEIASRMFLSTGTVRNYLSSAMNKLQAGGRIEAVNTARQSGWI
ncbi:response regulator transcription factor [Micromonospora rifamycinica]|uniref:response regulator transcription factor n=1 Tax=Micromonospora TaxID=1873 RepID=UPI002E1AB23E